MSIPILDNDGIEREIASDLTADGEVQRVSVPGVATAAKQDTAKEVLDAIAASAASVETAIASVYFDANGRQVVALDQPLPAGTNAIGTVGHGKTLKSVSLSLSTSGDNDIIAAVASKKLTIYALSLTTKADISDGLTAKFTDGAAGTQMWAADAMVPATQSWGVVEAVAPPGYLFQLTTNTKLVLNLSAAKATQVNVSYWEE